MTARLGIDTPPDLKAHLEANGPLPRIDARRGDRPGSLTESVEAAGLRGRGGGWFPTARKLNAVVASSAERGRLSRARHPLVIANGMEGEPASGKDAVLLQSSPHLVIDGIVAAAVTIGATDAFLAIHRDSPSLPALTRALDEREAAGIDPLPVRIATPPARYVASEESALSHWVGDGVATPVYPDRPFQRGSAGRPTLVQNVETLAHLSLVARHGSRWFTSVGAPEAPGTTLLTVGGAVRRPGVVEAPTGTTVAQIIEMSGGPLGETRGYLTGGYGGGWVSAAGFDRTPWDPEAVRAAGGVIGASVLWLMGAETCPLDEMARITAWMAGESAGQCGPCLFGLPSIADDMHVLAIRQAGESDMERLRTRLGLVTNRGGCKHPDGTARFVATGLAAFSDEVSMHLQGRCSVAEKALPGRALASMPAPHPRLAMVDVSGRDFS